MSEVFKSEKFSTPVSSAAPTLLNEAYSSISSLLKHPRESLCAAGILAAGAAAIYLSRGRLTLGTAEKATETLESLLVKDVFSEIESKAAAATVVGETARDLGVSVPQKIFRRYPLVKFDGKFYEEIGGRIQRGHMMEQRSDAPSIRDDYR